MMSAQGTLDYTYQDIAKMIDHSLLNPALSDREVEQGCQLARQYDVASVCIMPYYLNRCAEILKGSKVLPTTTIGFPHGGHATTIKLAEAKQALDDGAEEIDMVVNISKVISCDWDYVRADIKPLIDLAHGRGKKVKVIFENCYLDNEHKIKLCQICGELTRRLGKDVNGLRLRRGYHRRHQTDAATFAQPRPDKGSRRHT